MKIILNDHEHDTVAPLAYPQWLESVGYANRRIEAGRATFRAGRVPRKRYGSASSPLERTI